MQPDYSKYYNAKSLWEKFTHYAKVAGSKVVYSALLLYYVMVDKNTDMKTRLIIAAALGYFIFPLDAIPDLTPILGYADDLGVLLFTLSKVVTSITPEIKAKAREQVEKWFDSLNEAELDEIDRKTWI
jgi:uncharacterized membrane protein YkvA (DUF1232 family)